MPINAGVWIDHHKAVVVLLTDEGQEMLEFHSGHDATPQSLTGLRPKNSHMPSDFVAKGKRERQVMIHLNEYYDEVIACIRDAQAILIIGAGKAKDEFRQRIELQKFRGHIAEIKSMDKLTDHQFSDFVRQHFQ